MRFPEAISLRVHMRVTEPLVYGGCAMHPSIHSPAGPHPPPAWVPWGAGARPDAQAGRGRAVTPPSSPHQHCPTDRTCSEARGDSCLPKGQPTAAAGPAAMASLEEDLQVLPVNLLKTLVREGAVQPVWPEGPTNA